MNLDTKLFMHPQVEFAISNTDVLVKTQFKIFRLSGDVVESQLIPALQYFEKGVTLSELITLLSIDNSDKFVKDVIQPMVVRHWLTTNTETVTLDNHLQISNAFSSLGANGLEITDYLSTKKIAVLGLSTFAVDLVTNLQQYFADVELFLPNSCNTNIKYSVYDVSDLDSLFNKFRQKDLVLFTESKENTQFEYQLNRLSLEYNIKILFTRTCGFNVTVGPTLIPQKTGCLECLKFRQMNNSSFSKEFLAFNTGKHFIATPNDGNSVDVNAKLSMISMATNEAIKLSLLEKVLYKDDITLDMPGTLNTTIEFNVMTNTLNSNSFLKNPRCLNCGSHLYRAPEIKPWMESYTYPIKKEELEK